MPMDYSVQTRLCKQKMSQGGTSEAPSAEAAANACTYSFELQRFLPRLHKKSNLPFVAAP